MNIYELEKQATPGPWKVMEDRIEGTYIEGADRTMAFVSRAGFEDFKLVAHCRNNFLRALAALKAEHEAFIEENDVMHLVGRCPTCDLIAEMEDACAMQPLR